MLRQVNDIHRRIERSTPDLGHDLPIFARGALTLRTGQPDNPSGLVNQNGVYFTPYIGCYDFDEIFLDFTAIPAVANTNYDIFYYRHTLKAIAWASDVARAVALQRVQGYLRPTTNDQWAFIGTVRADSLGLCTDSVLQRFVSNYYNPILRRLTIGDSNSHLYNGAIRLWNGSTVNNVLECVICQPYGIVANGNHYSRVRAGAAGNFAITVLYLNGASMSPISRVLNSNTQYIETGSNSYGVLPTGLNTFNVYEFGDHASSTFNLMGMSVLLEC